MYDDRRGGGLFGAFLLGGLIGAVLGLLFAPRKGSETREILMQKGEELVDQSRDLYDEGRERVVNAYESSRTTATQTAEQLRERVGDASETAKSKLTEFKSGADKGVDRGAEAAKKGLDVAQDKASAALDYIAEKARKAGAAEGVEASNLPVPPGQAPSSPPKRAGEATTNV